MYVDYDFYTDTYGGRVDEKLFNVMEPKAEAYIRYLTFINGDVFAVSDVTAVQMAVCAAVDTVANNLTVNQSSGAYEARKGVKSVSNDGYSETYAVGDTSDSEELALRKKIIQAIRIYLLPTGWLNRVGRCACRDGVEGL